MLYVPVLLSTAFVDRPWKSLSYAFAASILAFTASAVSHGVEKASALNLLLALPAMPAVVWFTTTLANSIAHLHNDAEAERGRQREEVEQLRAELIENARVEREALLDETRRERAELKVKVDRLSESLANAARGDLSNANTAWSNAVDDADQTMSSLQTAFNNTLGNLRLLGRADSRQRREHLRLRRRAARHRRGARGVGDPAVVGGCRDHLDH